MPLSNSANVTSRLRKIRAPPLAPVRPIEDDSVIARLVQRVAPINIAAGLSTSDFHIPGALSVITPAVNDASTTSSSVPSSNILQQYPSTIPTSSSSLSSSPSSTRTRTNTDSL
ncbi:unnamed protein product, partial [Rotaria magnacalcarata]